MATDYDAPRPTRADEPAEDSLADLAAQRYQARAAVIDVEDSDAADSFELPGADLSGEELSVLVVPKRTDEFICASCFLVQHRSRLAWRTAGPTVCADCA
jgi:Domain of unknown function (DUF4193)